MVCDGAVTAEKICNVKECNIGVIHGSLIHDHPFTAVIFKQVTRPTNESMTWMIQGNDDK